jgi:serine protease
MRTSRALSIALLGTAAVAGAGAPVAAAADARFEVLLRGSHGKAAHASAARALLARAGARRAGPRAPEIGLETVAPTPGRSGRQLLAALRRDPRVRSVVPVQRLSLRAPNDPALTQPETAAGTPPGTVVEWAYARQGLDRLWDISHGDRALVGVVDTGATGDHPDLAGKISAGVDQNDDDGLPPTVDVNGHGTHVASLACGAASNGVGIAGAGGNCRLVIERTDLTTASVAASIIDATNRGAQAINLSLGSPGGRPPDPGFVAATDYAYQHGVVVVAAASDTPETDQGQPASILQPTGTGPDLGSSQIRGLTVTSATFGDGPSGGGTGSQVSLAAYGSFAAFGGSGGPRGLIGAFPPPTLSREMFDFSTFPPRPPCACRTVLGGDNRYGYLQGTSMATPQVAGAAAVVRTVNPMLSVGDVIRLLKQTARRPPGVGWTAALGWGILDGGAAADAARRIDVRAPTSVLRVQHVIRSKSRRITLRWSGSDPPGAPGLVASGIAFFDVYSSRDGKRLHRIAHTTGTQRRFTGRRGSRYRFWIVAVDRAGNREARSRRPKSTTRVIAKAVRR